MNIRSILYWLATNKDKTTCTDISFSQEKFDCYVLTAGVMTCGGIVYETKGRDDQAEIADHSIESV